jgi:hypothetical protein
LKFVAWHIFWVENFIYAYANNVHFINALICPIALTCVIGAFTLGKLYNFHASRVWRYQRGNHNPYIEEEQRTQWPKEKVQKDKQRFTNHTYKTKDRVTRTPLKTGGELGCSGRVGSSCSTNGTRRVNLVTNPVISREWGKDREVFTTSGTYPWSFVTQIFHNGQPSYDGDPCVTLINDKLNHTTDQTIRVHISKNTFSFSAIILEICFLSVNKIYICFIKSKLIFYTKSSLFIVVLPSSISYLN